MMIQKFQSSLPTILSTTLLVNFVVRDSTQSLIAALAILISYTLIHFVQIKQKDFGVELQIKLDKFEEKLSDLSLRAFGRK